MIDAAPMPAREPAALGNARQDKPWGHELIFAAGDDGYVGKVIHVAAGQCLSLQYHVEKTETMHVLSGVGSIELGLVVSQLVERRVVSGDTVHVPAGTLHRISALSDLTFVEASTSAPGWREDVVRLEDRYGRSGTSTP
jgi:mannose-6-phosphate isomerase